MTYLMVDISGRSPVYDIPLCEALHRVFSPEHHVRLLAPNINPKDVDFDCKRLFSILPHRLQKSQRKPFRAIKALTVALNYISLIARVALKKPDILHFQWLPLVEVSTIERIFIKILFTRTIAAKETGKFTGSAFPKSSHTLISSSSTWKRQKKSSVLLLGFRQSASRFSIMGF